MGEGLYKRSKFLKIFNEFFICIYLDEGSGGGGGALMHVYVYIGTHNQPFLQNHLIDVYET